MERAACAVYCPTDCSTSAATELASSPLLFPDDAVVGPRRAELGTNSDTGRVLRSVRDGLAGAQDWTPEALDKTIKTQDDVKAITEVPILGAILFDPDAVRRPLIVEVDPRSPRAEAFRSLQEAISGPTSSIDCTSSRCICRRCESATVTWRSSHTGLSTG